MVLDLIFITRGFLVLTVSCCSGGIASAGAHDRQKGLEEFASVWGGMYIVFLSVRSFLNIICVSPLNTIAPFLSWNYERHVRAQR
jgi:hypothetical protein